MFRKTFFTAASAALLASVPAIAPAASADAQAQGQAQAIATMDQFTVAQVRSYLDVIAQLESSGYTLDSVEKTFLGRMKITAHNRAHVREMVVSRSTGEIMHDAIVKVFASNETEGDGSAETKTSDDGDTASSGLDLSVSGDTTLGVDVGGSDSDDDDDESGGGLSVGVGASGGGGISIGN